jgi:hypothetical protein
MKEQYEDLEFEVIEFEDEDVITSSPNENALPIDTGTGLNP